MRRVLTWHVHGSYLYYLARAPHTFYLPVKEGRPEGYGGRAGNSHWPDNLVEVPAEDVPALELDCVIFQSHRNYLEDRYDILSDEQRRVPRIHLEHDPPRRHPTDTVHPVQDRGALLVHVTSFNELMWDNGVTPTRVIDHGVAVPRDLRYSGELDKGIVVVNGLAWRGRRLGKDVFERVQAEVPLDLVGMGSEELGGLGEVPHSELSGFISAYRFFFNPIRYTSLALAVCEAMMLGMPVVALATHEVPAAVQNGIAGYVDTSVGRLIGRMKELLHDRDLARRLGEGARAWAIERFDIERFARDWDDAIETAIALGRSATQGAAR